MGQHHPTRTVTTGPWLALFTALAVIVGFVALAAPMLVRSGPSNPQDAIARIPVSTATPYPYATTATPWKSETGASTRPDPLATSTP